MAFVNIRIFSSDNKEHKQFYRSGPIKDLLSDVNEEEKDEEDWVEVDYLGGVDETEHYADSELQLMYVPQK